MESTISQQQQQQQQQQQHQITYLDCSIILPLMSSEKIT